MKRKQTLFVIIDTETSRSRKEYRGRVFDFGYTIIDRYGNNHGKASFLATDILATDMPFYAKQLGKYYDMAFRRKIYPLPFRGIRESFNLKCKDLQAKGHKIVLCAYNAKFDFSSLDYTSKILNHRTFLNAPDLRFLCIWDFWAKTCPLNYRAAKTKSGMVRTNAESVYAFEFNKPKFIEEHTGFADAEIEAELLLKVLSRNSGKLPAYKTYKEIPGGQSWMANRRLGLKK
jgi:hypothetical protein